MNLRSSRTRTGAVVRSPCGGGGATAGVLKVRRRLVRALPTLSVIALTLLVGLPTILYPFGPDQAIFATIGKVISEGGAPYVDAWDQKPPAIYLIYAVAIRGPFGLMRNVRVFEAVWLSATLVLLVELGRGWWSPRAAWIGALLYGLAYVTTTSYWNLAQPDGFLALPLLLALLLHERGGGRIWTLIAAGVLLGFAFQLRFIIAALIPAIPLVEVTQSPKGERLRLWLQRMVWFGVGFAAFQGMLGGYLVAVGALGEYIVATRFASGYTKLGGPYAPFGLTLQNYLDALRFSFLWWALGLLVLTAPAIVGGFLGVVVRKERRVQQLVLFVALAYAGIAVQGKFFPYHWLLPLPFAALLAGWAWDEGFAMIRRSQPRALAMVTSASVVAALSVATPSVLDVGWNQWKGYVHYYIRPQERELFYDFFGPWNGGAFSYRASRDTAYYLMRRTEPGDSLYVWGYDPLIYLLADRPSASRFIYSFPLMSDWAPKSWQGEFLADLERRKPVYFVVQRYEGARWITGHAIDSGDYIAWFPALEAWIADLYSLETEIEDYLIYRRNATF